MSEPFLAEIRIMGFNFAPAGWAQCDGQILPINQNQSLYSLLGTTYGGDGRTSFALPDLRGRVPIHESNGFTLGHKSGAEAHILATNELPQHQHTVQASANEGTTGNPIDNVMAHSDENVYTGPTSLVDLNANSVQNVGASQGHNNMQPYITLNFCIALQGLFPSRN